MRSLALAGLGAALIVGFALWSSLGKTSGPMVSASPERRERIEADRLYGARPEAAREMYASFVKKHKGSADKSVQDEVAAARLRLGYLTAKAEGYDQARDVFLEAEREYKGEGKMGSDFGGLKDQAAYQAAVCLMAEKKDKEAVAALVAFLKEYQLSPLVHAAHRRLEMLAPESQSAHDELLQKAITAQEKHIRFETSVCGPKVISYLLEKLGKPRKNYKELAKLCGTTDTGTTLDGMRRGLKACGLDSFGYELNRSDFLRLPRHSILLVEDHFVALIDFVDGAAFVYDPVKGGETKMPLPKSDDTSFTITVLTLNPLELK